MSAFDETVRQDDGSGLDQNANADDPGVEDTIARPGGVSYLRIPARDVAESGAFYRDVFGWQLRGDPDEPSFTDGTGHVIGHWSTDRSPSGDAGVVPYIYVTDLDATLELVRRNGAAVVTEPYDEGASLRIANIVDPAGNTIGVWEERSSGRRGP